MIQDIIDGIIADLLEAFPGVTVYTEQVKQGLKEPCFIIRCVSPACQQLVGKRYYLTNLFSVQYIPENKTDARTECVKVTEKLFQALEYIKVSGDLQRGTGMQVEYIDDMLTFLVNYNMIVKTKPKTVTMKNLTVKIM